MENNIQKTDFNIVIQFIVEAQNKVHQALNKELVNLYWNIGTYVSNKVGEGKWGDNTVLLLSETIQTHFPNLKGFTKRGLYRMKQFYDTYNGIEKVSTLLTQILDKDILQRKMDELYETYEQELNKLKEGDNE